jgi:hypothetical protein
MKRWMLRMDAIQAKGICDVLADVWLDWIGIKIYIAGKEFCRSKDDVGG